MDSILWLVLAIGLFVFEGLTVQLVSVWFGIGSVGACLAAAGGYNLTAQLAIFTGISLILLVSTRPLVKKKLKVKQVATNADQVLDCIVTAKADFNPEDNTGRIRVNNLDWSASCAGSKIIKAGDSIKVKAIEGVTLIVELQEAAEIG